MSRSRRRKRRRSHKLRRDSKMTEEITLSPALLSLTSDKEWTRRKRNRRKKILIAIPGTMMKTTPRTKNNRRKKLKVSQYLKWSVI